jgi:hypothetical protein
MARPGRRCTLTEAGCPSADGRTLRAAAPLEPIEGAHAAPSRWHACWRLLPTSRLTGSAECPASPRLCRGHCQCQPGAATGTLTSTRTTAPAPGRRGWAAGPGHWHWPGHSPQAPIRPGPQAGEAHHERALLSTLRRYRFALNAAAPHTKRRIQVGRS